MPAEECITGSDAAGRAKSVSSEKQIEYNLSRNKDRAERRLKRSKQGVQFVISYTKFYLQRKSQDGKEKVVPLVVPLIQIKL